MISEIDFSLYQDKQQEKGFQFSDSDGTFYDLTGATVTLKFYKAGPEENPTNIIGVVDTATSTAVFTFTTSHSDTLGNFEYVVVAVKDGNETVLTRGNIIVKTYTPFSKTVAAFLEVELPEGMVLTENFVNQKTYYWRLFLQGAFNISDANLEVDAAWSPLQNSLIAKLIAHDALVVALRGNILSIAQGSTTSSSSSSSTQGGGVKSIETGPTKVEFLPAGEVVTNLLKSTAGNAGGIMQDIQAVLCGLANKLQVKIPMCKAPTLGGMFAIYKDADWEKLTLRKVLEEPIVSKG